MKPAPFLRTSLAVILAVTLLNADDGLAQVKSVPPTIKDQSDVTALMNLSKGAPVLGSFGTIRNVTVVYGPVVLLGWKASGGLATHYRASESSSFGGASWVALDKGSEKVAFTLSAGEGSKTVHFQLMNERNNEALKSEVRSVTVQRHDPPAITSFAIQNGAATTNDDAVRVKWTYSGTATDYRLSENKNFSDAGWNSPANQPSGVMFEFSDDDEEQKTIYLQLRRDDSSPVEASAHITLDKVKMEYVVSKAEEVRALLLHAQGKGYSIETKKLQGETCSWWLGDTRHPALIAEAYELPLPPATTCETKFFHGKMLAPGWTMQSVGIEAASSKWAKHCLFSELPLSQTNNPRFTIQVKHAGGVPLLLSSCSLTRITLKGPAGAHWRDAFGD